MFTLDMESTASSAVSRTHTSCSLSNTDGMRGGVVSVPTSAVPGTVNESPVRPGVSAGSGEPLRGFEWPGTGVGVAGSLASDRGYAVDDDETAWAGMDNAIPVQMQDRLVRGRGQAQTRVGTARSMIEERSDNVEMREERRCQPCKEEGEIACRGEVAIGVCKSVCVRFQFLGRGKGNGCENG